MKKIRYRGTSKLASNLFICFSNRRKKITHFSLSLSEIKTESDKQQKQLFKASIHSNQIWRHSRVTQPGNPSRRSSRCNPITNDATGKKRKTVKIRNLTQSSYLSRTLDRLKSDAVEQTEE